MIMKKRTLCGAGLMPCDGQRMPRRCLSFLRQVVSDLPPVNRTSGSMLIRFSPKNVAASSHRLCECLLTNLQLPRLIPKIAYPAERCLRGIKGTLGRQIAYRSLSGVLPLVRRFFTWLLVRELTKKDRALPALGLAREICQFVSGMSPVLGSG